MNAVRLLPDERFVELKANLLYFRDTYDAILAKQANPADPFASVRGSPYRRVGRIHHEYIEAQRREVQAMIERIAAMEAPDEPGGANGGTDAAAPALQ